LLAPEQTLGATSFFALAKKMRLFASRQKERSVYGKAKKGFSKNQEAGGSKDLFWAA